jgi:hypothetical protein
MIPHEWLVLDSEQIHKVKYVPNKHDLRGDVLVEFRTGKQYRFKDVQAHKIERVVHASSPGTVFHEIIRGQHDSEAYSE